ncbi:prevent-host-death family protein [Candidatus Methylomirabilis lanthanidiphila]|uniref:Antitoxin n=1 Tax=Candidatus Methylomirabilis lanthanidiphila TaxID=2211376 RepID=A0A564ZFK6_9BACT|nr:type II toxin-antitoxin system Phd/YefM family antitoxin [Candidatus Methylomirabilis lanthanidiphila]VUZ84105.1 prevent-host-death family protein [Candidatus Methylomirabilis lanthanidiphila]
MRVREVIPISDLRKRQAEVLAALKKGPAILTQHGKGAAVLLSLDAYNRLLEELEDLQDALDAFEARRAPGERVSLDAYLTATRARDMDTKERVHLRRRGK